jgi:predicted helicase
MRDGEQLDKLLLTFTNYERAEVRSFRQAVEQFKRDVPSVLKELRKIIDQQAAENDNFFQTRKRFKELCQEVVSPYITLEDTNEMLIQHILTEDIFTSIFNDAQYHRENNIARELMKVEETFFTGKVKRNTLDSVKQYYHFIQAQAGSIADHKEKKNFLKAIYEDFYKAYNPKAADRLGIVYTPSEIVEFMIESTDYLLYKHFGKLLADPNVEILDPATGTGTFICDLIEYLPKDKLAYKYQHELHCNEVSILPYYIANLNIEATFRQQMGYYEEFKNICFVDTLDNTGPLQYAGKQEKLFGFSAENAERIRAQNERKISVIIGNPPYNAKQENYNHNNANREYKNIDERIKNTYIKYSTAQNQNSLYDMYVRFFRWASDRVDKSGMVAFVTNNSFVNSLAFNGFRKIAAQEFNEIYIIDLKGNARTSGEQRRREGGNVFSDQIRVGVAIYFMIRNPNLEGCRIYYHAVEDYLKAKAKKDYLKENPIQKIPFQHIIPDKKHNWIEIADNDFDQLIPLIDKDVKEGKGE